MRKLGRKVPLLVAVAATVALGLAACSQPAASDSSTGGGTAPVQTAKVRMHVYPGALLSLPTYVAEAQGFFKEHNLEVEQVSFKAGPDAVQGLISGAVDITDNSLSNINIANEKFSSTGSSEHLLAVMGAVANGLHYSIVGAPGIDWPDPSDKEAVLNALENKTIGVTVVGADTQNVFQGLMAATGHDPSKATFVGVGIGASAIAAVANGQVDALVAAPPAGERVEEAGGKTLIDFRKGNVDPVFDGFMQTLYFASDKWLADNGDAANRMQDALSEAMTFMADPANLDTVAQIYVGQSEGLDLNSARDAVKNYIPLFTPDISCKGINNYNSFYIKYTNTFKTNTSCDDTVWSGAKQFVVN